MSSHENSRNEVEHQTADENHSRRTHSRNDVEHHTADENHSGRKETVSEASRRTHSRSPVKKHSAPSEPRENAGPPVPPRPDPQVQELYRKLEAAQGKLNLEKEQHARTKSTLQQRDQDIYQQATDLNQKDQEIQDVWRRVQNAEKSSQEKDQQLAEHAIYIEQLSQKKDGEIQDLRQRWKDAASTLNKFLAQGQGFSQITDRELEEKVKALRFNIRNFTDQQFSEDKDYDLQSCKSFKEIFEQYYKTMDDAIFDALLKSPSRRPALIRAFMWKFFQFEVFGKFCWAGTRVSSAMCQLTKELAPYPNDEAESGLDWKRKFHVWRATTTTLLIDATDLDKEDHRSVHRRLNENLVQDMAQHLSPFSKSKPKEMTEHLYSIFSEALNFDKMTSKQAAEIVWFSNFANRDPRDFVPDYMELQAGEQHVNENPMVWMVLAPGILKRGKSTGEDYQTETLILKMEVSCEPVTAQSNVKESNVKENKKGHGLPNVQWPNWTRPGRGRNDR